MADVYVGERPGAEPSDDYLALKLLLPKLAQRRKFVDMFVSEGRLGTRLMHPNIVRTHEVGIAAKHHYIAMEFIEGHDLGRLIRSFRVAKAPVPIPVALYVVHEVLAGLGHAHSLEDEQGQALELVNRDVSPANIMLGYDGSVRLIDFGIAQALLDYRSQIGSIKGKVTYMSPEQVRGLALDARSDLFSLGTVLYQLLTGNEPFQAPTEFEQMERVREANPPPAYEVSPRVPRRLSHLVAKAMAKDARARYQNADAMREAILEFCEGASLTLDRETLAGIMTTDFATQRERLAGEISMAREVLAGGGLIDPLDEPTPAPVRRPEVTPAKQASSTAVTPDETPAWLVPAILVMLGVAITLTVLVLLK